MLRTVGTQFKRFQKERILVITLDHFYDILAKNMTAFCPCPKNLPEAKLKSFVLMALAENISRQPHTDCAM